MRFDPDTHTLHVAGRVWRTDPVDTVVHDDLIGERTDWTLDPTFVSRVRRCRVRFESGWSASIVWGSGTYSTNHDHWHTTDPWTEQPATVEIGVCDRDGELRERVHRDDDGYEWHDVECYLTDHELVILLDMLAEMPTDFDYGRRPPSAADITREMRDFLARYGHLDGT